LDRWLAARVPVQDSTTKQRTRLFLVFDIAIFVLKRDVKLQLTD